MTGYWHHKKQGDKGSIFKMDNLLLLKLLNSTPKQGRIKFKASCIAPGCGA